MGDAAAIVVEGVEKRFGRVRALDGVSLQVAPGSVFGLLGPNGAGKTTLVRVLATLLRPDRGTARVLGRDAVREPFAVRRLIGLAGQFAAVDEVLTGRENLVMVGRLYHLPRGEAERRAAEVLERFGLAHAADRRAGTYSGGMRRRLDLAATLVGAPRVVFLDEPTTGLDPRSRSGLWEQVERLRDEGTTILLTTQYLEEADRLAGRIAVIDRGSIVAEGTGEELKEAVGGTRVAVRVAHPEDLAAAGEALGRISADGPPQAGRDGELTVPVDGPGAAAEALRALDAAGVGVSSLEVHRPTLDDVFLAFTGRTAEGAADEEVSADGEDTAPQGGRRRTAVRR